MALLLSCCACAAAAAPPTAGDGTSSAPPIPRPHPAATECVAGHERALAALGRGRYPLLAVPRTGWFEEARALAKEWGVDVRWVTRAAVRDDHTYEAACFNLTVLAALERRFGASPQIRGDALFCGTKGHTSYFAGATWLAQRFFLTDEACDDARRSAFADIARGELVQPRSALPELNRILAAEHGITIRGDRSVDPIGTYCYAQEMENAILERQGPFVFINALERAAGSSRPLL